ncbi:MAG: PAS domain-containing protein, partial [Candidatus Nanoarchaeia archaeon]
MSTTEQNSPKDLKKLFDLSFNSLKIPNSSYTIENKKTNGENMINGKGVRVLFVEDNEDDMLLLKRMLTKSGEEIISKRVETAADFERELNTGNWDITIVDFRLPSFDGREALKIFKRSGIDIPFILVSGTIGEELAVEMMKLGASDYIMKNNLPRLVPAVKKELEDAEERKKHRATLARVHMLAEIVESAEVGVIAIDNNNIVNSMNTGAEKILGISAPSIIGKKISEIKNPSDLPCFDTALVKFREGQKISGKELCVKTEKLGTVFILTTFSHIINAGGEIIGNSIIFHDITLQRKAEAELHDTQRWMMETLNSLKAGVVLINPVTRRILGANNAAVDMLGLSQTEIVGKECVGLICDSMENCSVDIGKMPENHFESVLPKKNIPVLKNVQKTTLSGK